MAEPPVELSYVAMALLAIYFVIRLWWHFRKENKIRAAVFEALDNAVGDYPDRVLYWSFNDLAADLIAYDSDLEDYKPEELLEFICEWRARRYQRQYEETLK